MTAEEIEIIVTAKIEEALKELNKIVPAIKEKMKQVQETLSKADTKAMTIKLHQAVNFMKKKMLDLKKSSENNKIAIKVNNKDAQKQISQIQKQIDSLQEKINARQLKLNVINPQIDKIVDDTKRRVTPEGINPNDKVMDTIVNNALKSNKDFTSLNSQAQKLYTEIEMYNKQLSEAKNRMTQLNQETNKTATTQNKLSSFFSNFKQKIGTAFKQMPKTGQNITRSLRGMGSSLKAGLGQIFKIAGALFGLQTIYSTLRSAASTWLSSQNSQAKQLSANIDYMKYALGSTLAPVIQYIVNLVYQALKGVQSLIYALTGVNIFANASAKAYSNMANSAKSAGKATKALNPGDIDEVHNIQDDNSGSGGNGGAGSVMPNIDLGQVDTKLNAFLKKIKDGKWYEAGAEIGKKLNESLRKIPWTKIKETAGNIGKGIAEFINGGIENIDWNLVGSTLGEGLNTAIIFLKKFVTTLNFASIVDAIFNFLVGTISTINWGDIAYIIFYMIGVNFGVQVRQLWNVISIACSSIGTFFHNKIAEAGGNVALGLWNGILEGLGNIAKWLYDNVIYPFIDGFKNGMGIHSPSTVMFELRKICNARAFEPE
jgi:predicted  nucleic acid-binding Zn-ribbon protein